MAEICITKVEASKILGVSTRMVNKYLQSGELTEDHKDKGRVMIPVIEVYSLRAKNKQRKRGL